MLEECRGGKPVDSLESAREMKRIHAQAIRDFADQKPACLKKTGRLIHFQTLQKASPQNLPGLTGMQSDFLILNSLSFFEKSRIAMESYSSIHLLLDRDKMGMQCTEQALKWSAKYQDKSQLYDPFKDLNEYLIQKDGQRIKQRQHRGLGL